VGHSHPIDMRAAVAACPLRPESDRRRSKRDPPLRAKRGLNALQQTASPFDHLFADAAADGRAPGSGRLAFDDHDFERAANDAAGLCWRLFMFGFRPFCMAHSS
jgi:hypothetical protein